MNSDCIFCKIAQHAVPARIAWEDEHLLAFHDLHPQAPVHVLVIPRTHVERMDLIGESEKDLMGHLMVTIPVIARHLGLDEGFRVVANCKETAGQSVWHLHFHLMGKRSFSWPPG